VSSFQDHASGLILDNCQHVLLGCCHEAIDFLSRLGSLCQIDFADTTSIIGNLGEKLRISCSPLPAPFHLLPSILATGYLLTSEKFTLSRMLMSMMLHSPGKTTTASDYLKALSCPEGVTERLIEPVIVSALNERAGEASAKYARMALLEALVKSRDGYRLGVPKTPQSQWLGEAAKQFLSDRECEVRTGAKVKYVQISDGRVRAVELAGEEMLKVDYCVCAVPPDNLVKMGLEPWGGERLVWRPIVSAHLFYEEPVPEFEPACVVNEPFQWVFCKHADVGYVQAVASAAEDLINKNKDETLELARRAVEKVEPVLTKVALKRGIVYKGRRATFSTLACDAHRPPAQTPVRNLFLAGDWTDTHWPATIESAVRSGHAAARTVMMSIQ